MKRMISLRDERINEKDRAKAPVKKKEDPSAIKEREVPQHPSCLFFQYNTQLGPPYHILVDTNFINFSIKAKLDLVQSMMDCLYAKCIPCITDCVMGEIEKLGQKYRVALSWLLRAIRSIPSALVLRVTCGVSQKGAFLFPVLCYWADHCDAALCVPTELPRTLGLNACPVCTKEPTQMTAWYRGSLSTSVTLWPQWIKSSSGGYERSQECLSCIFPGTDTILRGCQMTTALLDSNLSSQAVNARTLSQDKGPSGSSPPASFFAGTLLIGLTS
ncbi:rRNA-processing protein FCF1 homolog isoform 1-T1 [Leptosomus discolor]